jgi:hypothetical protein
MNARISETKCQKNWESYEATYIEKARYWFVTRILMDCYVEPEAKHLAFVREILRGVYP